MALSAIGAGAVATAGAQDPEEPEGAGDYGGGAIAKLGKGPYSAGNMVISLQPGSDRVHVEASLGERCHVPRVRTVARLDPDGSFSEDGIVRERQSGFRLRSTYKITGKFGPAGASGTASAKTKVTKPKHRTRRCQTGTVQWEARRRSTGVIGRPGATPPGARMYGNTSQLIAYDLPAAIVLRVSGDGTRLTRAIYNEWLECGGRFYSTGLDSPATSLPIAADGTISDVERLSYRVDHRTRATSVERFKGTLGSTGATGTLSARVREVDIPTGRVLRCHTGAVKWTATL